MAEQGPSGGVRLDHVSIGYGGVDVVHDVSLEIKPGESVALLGANGAGKSSVVKAVVGAVRVSSGSIWIGDRESTHLNPSAVARMGVSCVPEGRRVFGSHTVEDNLRVGAWASKLNRRELSAKVDEMLDRFPLLAERSRTLASSLSGGQAQLLSIAMALMSNPTVLIVDEPSLGLAPVMIDAVVDEIGRLADEGTTVLVVDENFECALATASRAYVLRGGRIVLERETALLNDPVELHDAYMGGLFHET